MSQTVVLKVGMSCQGCVGAVQRVLAKMEGVDSFEINKDEQKVTVIGNVKPEDVFQTVSKTGKKTSFWETEPKPEPAITNIEAEPEPKPKPESEPAPVAELTKTTEPEPEAVTVATTDATTPPSTAA